MSVTLPPDAGWHFQVMANEPERIHITAETPEGSLGEFSIVWVPLGDEAGPRLECFDDGWRLLAMSGLLDFMATWPQDMTVAQVLDALTEWSTGGPEILTPQSPCTARITPGDDGGITVAVEVPTFEGGAIFTISTERDADGDWRVFIPWSGESSDDEVILADGHSCMNGILYLGAPDVEVPWRATS